MNPTTQQVLNLITTSLYSKYKYLHIPNDIILRFQYFLNRRANNSISIKIKHEPTWENNIELNISNVGKQYYSIAAFE